MAPYALNSIRAYKLPHSASVSARGRCPSVLLLPTHLSGRFPYDPIMDGSFRLRSAIKLYRRFHKKAYTLTDAVVSLKFLANISPTGTGLDLPPLRFVARAEIEAEGWLPFMTTV